MIGVALNFILILILLCCSAYFAACETAISAYSRPRMYSLFKYGNENAKIIIELQPNIEIVISAILTCNTILNTGAVTLAERTLHDLIGDGAIIYSTIVMSILVVFFAEVLPKMVTISNPERILLPSAKFISFVYKALRPLNKVMRTVAIKLLDLVGFKHDTGVDFGAQRDELKGAIDLHRGNGGSEVQERAMLKSILDLGNVHISKIMTHRKNVTMLNIDDNPDSLIEQILMSPFTRLPFWKTNQDNIIGVLHVKDLLRAVKEKEDITRETLEQILKKPWFTPENTDLLDQLQAFRIKREHFSVVVDEYGSFMGIITLEDILEEIVGDISDEHDIASVQGVRKQDDGSYIVDGSINVRDLNRELDLDFPGNIAATVAGLVINSVGIIPQVGQIFSLYGFKFEIMKRHRNQVTLLRITKLENE